MTAPLVLSLYFARIPLKTVSFTVNFSFIMIFLIRANAKNLHAKSAVKKDCEKAAP